MLEAPNGFYVLKNFYFFKWAIPGLFFFIFCLFNTQLIVYNNGSILINFCRWLDSNRGPLVSEATALPTEPQPLPCFKEFKSCKVKAWNYIIYRVAFNVSTWNTFQPFEITEWCGPEDFCVKEFQGQIQQNYFVVTAAHGICKNLSMANCRARIIFNGPNSV